MARPAHDTLRETALDRAEAVLAAEGLGALTARRVAADSGVSVGTLYNLFGHLDGLIRALNRRTMARLRARLAAALEDAADAPVDARLAALAHAYLDFALAHPEPWDALFRHRMDTPPETEREDEVAAMGDLLARAAGPGVAEDVLMALWAATHGVVELATTRRLPASDPALARRYLDIILAAATGGAGRAPS
ncbi:MAG: TetR/AcrR family transcriptional regulator [Pseudomonadota bacterium]